MSTADWFTALFTAAFLLYIPLVTWEFRLRKQGKRPLTQRVWFWKPQWHWFGWRTLLPFARGGDQWDWHTIVLGWTVTGRVIIATRRCPQKGRCAPEKQDPLFRVLQPDWPADPYADN